MERQHARRAPQPLQQSAVDNSLSTYIHPEKERSQPPQHRTGALSALKASFGIRDANSPTRAQLTPTSQQKTPTATSSPKQALSASSAQQRQASSFGKPQSAAVDPNTDNWEHAKLYEAYNQLHSLAQVFRKPFDAPAILVVGHQTDGKSGVSQVGFACF
jgi:hypothetical protein